MTTVVRRTPPKLPRPYPAPLVGSPVIDELREQLAAVVPEKSGVVIEEFWRRHQRRPVVDARSGVAPTVTFLWRDAQADEVLLFINRMIDEWALGDSLMRRVEGTDVWWLAYRMDPDWRASYAFLPRRHDEPTLWAAGDPVRLRQALGQGRHDPGNPVTCRNRAGVTQSVVELPGAPAQRWLAPRSGDSTAADLSLADLSLADLSTGGTDSVVDLTGPEDRRLWVYRPDHSEETGLAERTPVILAFDGDVWNGRVGESTQDLPTTLRNLTADGLLPPALAIMIDSGSRDQRWRDLDPSTGIGGYLAEVLLPWVRERFGVRAARDEVIVTGQSLGGLVALSAGISHPEAIGNVVAQSASLWQDDLRAALGDRNLAGSRFCVQFGRQEWSLRRPNLVLARELRAQGADVTVQVHNGGHDYAWWRGAIGDGLAQVWDTSQLPHEIKQD